MSVLIFASIRNPKASFPDVSFENPYFTSIEYLRLESIVHGFSDGTFKPKNSITRGEFTKIIVSSIFDPTEISSCKSQYFPDVDETHIFFNFVCIARKKNAINGFSDGNFKPDKFITTAEASKVISNSFKLTQEDQIVHDPEHHFRNYIDALFDIKALPPTLKSLTNPLLREEMAEMIYRIRENVKGKESISYDELYKGEISATPSPTTPFPSTTIGPTPIMTNTPQPPDEKWIGYYYSNIDFQGEPTIERFSDKIDFNFKYDSPDPTLPRDNFSIRWKKRVYLEGGTYIFSAKADDGIRVFIDGEPVIDAWDNAPYNRFEEYVKANTGTYEIVVEYFDRKDEALAFFEYELDVDCEKKAAIYGMNVDVKHYSDSINDMANLGVKWVRIEFVQSPNANNDNNITERLNHYRHLISSFHSKGIKVLLLVNYSSFNDVKVPSDVAPGDPRWQTYRRNFVSAVSRIASEYGDTVAAWQIWNEPDLFWGRPTDGGFDPGIPPEEFGKFLVDAGREIRKYSLSPMIIGGLVSGQPEYYTKINNTALSYGGNLNNYEGLGLHPFGRRVEGYPHKNWYYGELDGIIQHYAIISNKKIWITEIGLNKNDLQYQAEYIYRLYEYVKGEVIDHDRNLNTPRIPVYDVVPAVFWFAHTDEMGLPGEEFGIREERSLGFAQKESYIKFNESSPEPGTCWVPLK